MQNVRGLLCSVTKLFSYRLCGAEGQFLLVVVILKLSFTNCCGFSQIKDTFVLEKLAENVLFC